MGWRFAVHAKCNDITMLQITDGITIDQKNTDFKVVKDDFEQALQDMKPVGILWDHVISY